MADVNEIDAKELVRRVMVNMRGSKYKRHKQQRWVWVMDTFGLGSTYAMQLCRLHELDPDEMI